MKRNRVVRIFLALLVSLIVLWVGYLPILDLFVELGLISPSTSLFSVLSDLISALFLTYGLFVPSIFVLIMNIRMFKHVFLAALPALLFGTWSLFASSVEWGFLISFIIGLGLAWGILKIRARFF